jgi:hypothetical protein
MSDALFGLPKSTDRGPSMQKALSAALATLAIATSVAAEDGARAVDVTTVGPPPGLVTAMHSQNARTMLKNLSGGLLTTLINGFVTADDLQRLDSGGIARGNRYALVLQPAQFTGRAFTPASFASLQSQLRQVDPVVTMRNDVNAQEDAQKDSRPAMIRDLHIISARADGIVLDTSTCTARSSRSVVAIGNQQITVYTIIAFVYANQQMYSASGYAIDTPADTHWLADDYLPWLRGICGAR